jgi:hypothetical protein
VRDDDRDPPAFSFWRKVIATLIVAGVTALAWKVIDYRTQPPPPPHKIGERVELR